MNVFLGAAILCLAAWTVLVFVITVPSGWIHVLLAAGFVLLARGIIGTPRR